jgi:predicted NodU family carbamoyl transferase
MLIIWIHDATRNLSMSVLYNKTIYSIELERLIWIKSGLYSVSSWNFFSENYAMWQWTTIQRDKVALGDYWVFIMFKYFIEFLWFNRGDIDLIVSSSWRSYENIFWKVKTVYSYSHHLMHAYSSFYISWFFDSNILVIDWAWYDISNSKIELISMYKWSENGIENIYTQYATKKYNISIGIAYERVADFLWLTEWKLMWLSWYGLDYTKYNFFNLKNWEVFLKSSLHSIFCNKKEFLRYYNLEDELLVNWILWIKIVNFAYSFQKEVEEAILYIANELYKKNNCKNLCYSWWVALNCLTNYRLKNEL